jgi:tetratricopeptide (TPR) repeat protein
MSRFHQQRQGGDATPPPEGRRRPANTDPEDEGARRWQADPIQQASGSLSRSATLGCLGVLLVPLVMFMAVALQNGSWDVDRYRHEIERGKSLSVSEKLDDAMSAFQEAHLLRPEAAEPYYFMGEVHMEREEWQACEEIAREGLRLDPQHPALWNMLGIVRGQQGDSEEEFSCFQKAIEADPTYATAYKNIASLYLQRGNGRAAINALETYLRLDPNAHDRDKVQDTLDAMRRRVDL